MFRALPVMVIALLWASAAAAEAPSMPGHPEGPMAISSRSMTVKNLDHRVIFDRDVVVKKGDMNLQADRMEVILATPPNEAAGHAFSGLPGAGGAMLAEDNVERIEASGRVKVVQGGKTATADQAVYHRADETVVLTGRPETWEDGYRIQGSRITILLKEQRSIVEESRVVIYPDDGSAASGGR